MTAVHNKKYDVIVVGGGHAGYEAAAAAARIGAEVIMCVHNAKEIGRMSCNPSIGGIAKGVLVREIDALDGVMGVAVDRVAIHSSMLNSSKGPAVHGPRVQAERNLYPLIVQEIISSYSNIMVYESVVVDLILKNNVVCGVSTECNQIIYAKSVVIATGTFLDAEMFCGKERVVGGRRGSRSAGELAKSLRRYFPTCRLLTGTTPRIDGSSVNWSKCAVHESSNPPVFMSFLNSIRQLAQISCYVTYTNNSAHQIVRDNAHLSPFGIFKLFDKAVCPRYCVSLERKVVKFADKTSHRIFLEPEDREFKIIYPSFLGMSLPPDLQKKVLHTMDGLETAKIIFPGYTVVYDAVDPRFLRHTLEAKKIKNLFLAGQINGTTGYEEAGSQGLVAGANAAFAALKKEHELVLRRDNSYIGVMIDDLVSLGVDEPYRMFTSRVEHRLVIRADNADCRLTKLGFELGLVNSERYKKFIQKDSAITKCKKWLQDKMISNIDLANAGVKIANSGEKVSLYNSLRFNNNSIALIKKLVPEVNVFDANILYRVYVDGVYEPYVQTQTHATLFDKEKNMLIPKAIDYSKIQNLSFEVREKLFANRPVTIGAASRISGVTPAAIVSLIFFIRKMFHVKQ